MDRSINAGSCTTSVVPLQRSLYNQSGSDQFDLSLVQCEGRGQLGGFEGGSQGQSGQSNVGDE